MSWGGARQGAGRPARGPVPSEPHKTRPQLSPLHPVHVTARFVPLSGPARFGTLRARSAPRPSPAPAQATVRRSDATATRGPAVLPPRSPDKPTLPLSRGDAYRVLHRAFARSLARADFRIVRFAVLRSRLELVVEANDKVALARGMQGFQVSAAKWLNRAAQRRGTVFPDRYRMRILPTRAAVRDVIGRLPLARTNAWPETWLLRIETAFLGAGTRAPPRRSMRTRADEDS